MSTNGYLVYGGQYTRTGLVLMLLDYAGADYQIHWLDLSAEEHRTKAFLTINPAGFVPAIRLPDGRVMHETPAIMLYLAERHELKGLMPSAKDAHRAAFLTGFFFVTNDIQPEIKRFYFPTRYAPSPEHAKAIHEQALAMLLNRFRLLDEHLNGVRYYLGDRISLVDLLIAFWSTSIFPRDRFTDACPTVAAHADRVQTHHEAFARHIHEHTQASYEYWRERLPSKKR